MKSGGRWADVPEVYGPRKTHYNRFVRWAAKWVWRDVFHALASAGDPLAELLIDSSAVKQTVLAEESNAALSSEPTFQCKI